MKKAKWLSEEALQIAVKRKEAKSEEKRKDIPIGMQSSKEQQGKIRKPSSVINAKKEENNRIGKIRDLFKKIRDINGTFHAKMSTMKDRNSMDLTEAEGIKKRHQQYTELYKKDLYDPDNHDGVITHLKPDILECEVKWALGSISINKTIGGEGMPAELFQSLKDNAV